MKREKCTAARTSASKVPTPIPKTVGAFRVLIRSSNSGIARRAGHDILPERHADMHPQAEPRPGYLEGFLEGSRLSSAFVGSSPHGLTIAKSARRRPFYAAPRADGNARDSTGCAQRAKRTRTLAVRNQWRSDRSCSGRTTPSRCLQFSGGSRVDGGSSGAATYQHAASRSPGFRRRSLAQWTVPWAARRQGGRPPERQEHDPAHSCQPRPSSPRPERFHASLRQEYLAGLAEINSNAISYRCGFGYGER